MKKIGEGYYYNVYDIKNGRVLKKQKNKFQIFIFIFFANRLNIKNSIQEYKSVINSIPKGRKLYLKIFNTGIHKNLIGNPTLLNGIDYEQDTIKPASKEDFFKLINDNVNLIKSLWEFGIHESVYNFTINNGYSNDKLVLTDFNEVTFNIEDVIKDIENKIWLKRSSYNHLDNNEKIKYANLMEKEITQENLKKHWAIKVVNTI